MFHLVRKWIFWPDWRINLNNYILSSELLDLQFYKLNHSFSCGPLRPQYFYILYFSLTQQILQILQFLQFFQFSQKLQCSSSTAFHLLDSFFKCFANLAIFCSCRCKPGHMLRNIASHSFSTQLYKWAPATYCWS